MSTDDNGIDAKDESEDVDCDFQEPLEDHGHAPTPLAPDLLQINQSAVSVIFVV